jgi:hypothetical protein
MRAISAAGKVSVRTLSRTAVDHVRDGNERGQAFGMNNFDVRLYGDASDCDRTMRADSGLITHDGEW